MKYRFLGSIAALLVVAATSAAVYLDTETDPGRYHQHLEEPGYTPCSDHGENVFCSHLPLVLIDTEGQEVPGKSETEKYDRFYNMVYTTASDGSDYINVEVAVIDNEEGNNHLTDTPDFVTRSLFRIRGNSSRRFEKKPYLMKFVDETGANRDISVMGMDAHSEWALHGPYMDKSLVRNYMWYNIAGEIMDYAPNVRYCEVFVNGEYRGLYLMTETITEGSDARLPLKKNEKGTDLGGYLLRIDRPTEKDLGTSRDVYVLTERLMLVGMDVAARYPGKQNLTPELAKQIELDFSAFEKALYSYDHDTEDYGYWNWIDVDSFVDYYLLNEFTSNGDANLFSTYIYKSPGEKLKMCVWDFNNACNNYKDGFYGADGFLFPESGYYIMLFRDEEFVERVIERYRQLRKSFFSEEYIRQYIEGTIAWLGPAVERNSQRWENAYAEDMLTLHPERNQHSLEEAVTFLEDWLTARGEWIDGHIESLRFYGHPSRNKKYDH